MIREYFPDAYCKSVFSIDYKKLYAKGIRALLFDIDNTLVHHGDDATPEIEALFRRLHRMGLKTILITDNGQARTQRFLRNLDVPYICDANKPSPEAYLRALQMLQVKKSQAVVIGDQIFKDIRGANNSGIPSILVQFIRAPGETWIGWRRYLEYLLLAVWRMTRSHRPGEHICNKNER